MLKPTSFDKLAGTTLGNYRLERFIGQSKIGPTFLARADSATTYLLRFLEGPMFMSSRDHEVYLEHFQYQAGQVSALQHPYILPLLDFGVYRGFPYLVSPHIPLRSLRSRVEKNGVLNTFTVGRYLDQIATALEYSHEHAVLHGSLSVDSIFIRLDGQLVVADVGVRSLLGLNAQDTARNQLLEWSEAYAPEQLLGKPASPMTDVYALGMVVYHLLTGTPVFEGSTPDEIAQQHLYASVPPPGLLRSDLPPGLYSILVRALAKDPAQRYHQPGAFANAYHNAIGSTNRTRMPFVIASEVPTVLPYGAGAPTTDTPFTERARSNNHHISGSTSLSSIPHSLHGFSDDVPLKRTGNPRQALMDRFGRKQRRRTLLTVALVALLVLVSGVAGITLLAQKGSTMSSAGGQVTFYANQSDPAGQTNSLHITIQHLAAPPAGNNYAAWIINDQSEALLSLGRLAENGQTWSLTFSGSSSNLLTVGDKLEITQEQGVVTAPTGTVILSGTFPVMAFQHVQHLLVSFPETPGKVGMLIGLLQQTHLLDSQAVVLQSVSTSRDPVTIGCVTQGMLNIVEGTQGAHYQPLSVTCSGRNVAVAGDGFGLLGKGFVAGAEEHASLALSQKDATSVMRQHATLMNIALTNVTGWVTTIEHDLLHLRSHPTDLSALQEITTLADDAYHGVDVNGDGQIDPVAGEAGALTAYQQAQLMATITLALGAS
jgi:serine/threonine protein kinase